MLALAYAFVWLFVFSVPWENVIVIPGVGAISRVTGALGMGFTVLAVVMSGRVRRWHLFHGAAFLFVLCAALEQFFFHAQERLPFKFWTYVQLLLVLWMTWELAPTRRRQLGLLAAYVFGAYVAVVDTVVNYRRATGFVSRFTAEGFDPNDLAMVLALALPMAWYLATVTRRPVLRWLYRAYLPAGIVVIGLTGSRGGMLAGLVALLVVPLTVTRLSPTRLAMALVMLAVSGVLAVTLVPETSMQRLASTGTAMEGGLNGRWKLWVAGARVFLHHPWLGHGTSAFKPAVTPLLGPNALVAHNSYLSVLVEQGIVGFLLFLAMLVSTLRALRSLPWLERRFTRVLFATLCVAMLPLTWEDNKSTWLVLALLVGLAQAYRAEASVAPDARHAAAGVGVAPTPARLRRIPMPAPRAGRPGIA